MFNDPKGPIEHFSWGKFTVCGEEHGKVEGVKMGAGKDIRIIGKKVSRWKEREGHLLSPDMITGVFDKKIEVLIIGIGVDENIDCPEHVKKYIKSKGIKNLMLQSTREACRTYNELYHEGKKVALLAHGTC